MMHGGIKDNNVSAPCLWAEVLLTASDDMISRGPLKIDWGGGRMNSPMPEGRLSPNVS